MSREELELSRDLLGEEGEVELESLLCCPLTSLLSVMVILAMVTWLSVINRDIYSCGRWTHIGSQKYFLVFFRRKLTENSTRYPCYNHITIRDESPSPGSSESGWSGTSTFASMDLLENP